MGIISNLSLLHDFGYDLSTIEGRLRFGKDSERVSMYYHDTHGFGSAPLPPVSKEWGIQKKREIEYDAMNGDHMFRVDSNGRLEFVDVKGTNYLAVSSLDRFRTGGYYFFNALTWSPKMYYFMVEKNDAFVDLVKMMCEYKKDDSGAIIGYYVNYWNIPNNPEKFGVYTYKNFMPDKYKNVMSEIRCDLPTEFVRNVRTESYEKERPFNEDLFIEKLTNKYGELNIKSSSQESLDLLL